MAPERSRGASQGEQGSAIVEFIGATVLLLVPLVYLVLTVGRLQAGAYAVDGGARDAARAFVTASSTADGATRARVAVSIALQDQGFDPDPALAGHGVQVTCSADPCLSPGGTVTATVRTSVPLPLVPAALRSWVPLEIPVESSYRASVDQFSEAR